MLESEMMEKGFEYLSNQKEYKIVKQEVPFLSRCIDIVVVDKNDSILSIEFKVSKWRHAIEQAINHKLGADMAYICIPKRRTTDVLLQALEKSGVGLLYFDEENDSIISEVVPAKKKTTTIPAFRQLLIDNLYKV